MALLEEAAVTDRDGNPGNDCVCRRLGTQFDPLHVDVTINGVMVCRDSGPGEPRESVDLSAREITVVVDLHAGSDEATIVTTDLTTEYVHENSAYST